MAIEAMVAVLTESASTGSARLVLIGMANQASNRGELLHYARSQMYLAKMANVGRSTVRKSLDDLAALGELELVVIGNGRRSSSYLIHLPSLCEKRHCTTDHQNRGGYPSNPLSSESRGLPVQPPEGYPSNPQRVTRPTPHHSVVTPVSPLAPTSTSMLTSSSTTSSPTTLSDSLTTTPPNAPPPPTEQPFQTEAADGATVPPERWNRPVGMTQETFDRIVERRNATHALVGTPEPERPPPAPRSPQPAPPSGQRAVELAAKPTEQDERREYRIKHPDKLERLLTPHGIRITSQTDRRNLSKLSEIRPTANQIDGACNALQVMEGKVELGRLVAKWDVLAEETASKPAGWWTWRDEQKAIYQRHIDNGGTRYDFDGNQKGMYQ